MIIKKKNVNENTYMYTIFVILIIINPIFIRQKMAKFAWQMGSEPITSAVAAARIYGSMAKNVHRNESALKEKVLIFKE